MENLEKCPDYFNRENGWKNKQLTETNPLLTWTDGKLEKY